MTDERLRSWLDSNQLDRERLCLSILSLDQRLADVRPRQPRGGPDGGRDLEARHQGSPVWVAIGFQNSVSDSSNERAQAIRKFEADLERALAERSDLVGFIFMTNVELTVGDEDVLLQEAHRRGVTFCDIYDRERLRIALDSSEGFGIRYQYLRIPLSEPEQAAFFARWGSTLEEAMAQSFHGWSAASRG